MKLILAIALLLRLALVIAVPRNGDSHLHYLRDAQIIRAGGNIYAEMPNYNYSPVFAYMLAALPDPVDQSDRVLTAFADLLNAVLIYATASRLNLPARLCAAVYLFNPIVLINGGYLAAHETFALVAFLAAVYIGAGAFVRAAQPGYSSQAKPAVRGLGSLRLRIPAAQSDLSAHR